MEHLRSFAAEVRDDPTRQWLTGYAVSTTKSLPRTIPRWFVNRVPFIRWIPRYDWRWTLGDFIAGLTVGLMLVPQSIAYADVADIPVQFGLYASYVAPILYTFIGTSKDLTIGPTAVVSLLTAGIIKTLPGQDPATVAIAIAFVVGIYAICVGVLKLGIILDFFPGGVLTGYTGGAAMTIAIQQVPKLLGEYDISTRNKTGTVIHDCLASLGDAHWRDILFAIGSMIALIGLQTAGKKYGSKNKVIWFISVARNTFVVIIFTAISYGINKGRRQDPVISIIGTVPAGLYKPAVPDLSLLSTLFGKSVTVFLAAVLEHIAIGKAFARKDKYQLDQNQELFSIGLVNIVGSFFGAYAVTGSFSRTAVNNASGSRSPLSGLMCSVVVIISVVAVTPAFFYISNATLGAVIFLAVIQLVAGPRVWYQLWRLSFWDFLGGQLAFWVTLFYSTEVGIYTSVGYSLVVLLWRVARPSIRLLAEVVEDPNTGEHLSGVYADARDPSFQVRAIQPLPGVLVIRYEESFTFPNSRYIKNQTLKQVYAFTSNGSQKPSKRLWNSNEDERIESIRARAGTSGRTEELPKLRGLILDFSAVNFLDSTGLQTLFDMRAELQDYAGSKEPFEMHFVCVHQAVLRILMLADVAAPIDRPEKNVIYDKKTARRELPLVRGDTLVGDKRLKSRSGKDIRRERPVRRSSASSSSTRGRRFDEGDNFARANDPAPVEAEGFSPITDPHHHEHSGGHAAFLDPENDKFLIHLSISQALQVIEQRLHLQKLRSLEEEGRSKEVPSEGSSDQTAVSEAASQSSSTSGTSQGRHMPVAPATHDNEPLSKITGDDGLRLEED